MKRVKLENVSLGSFYPRYLRLVNVILPKPLTNKEIEILTAFMELKGDIEKDRFGTQARKLVRDKFGLPSEVRPAGFTLLTKGMGRSAQGRTNIEKILSPIHKLQANGYDALANVLIQKAIKDSNLVSERDLLSGTVSATESQNIKLGKVDI